MPVFFWKFILSDIKAMPHKHKSLLNVIKSLVFFFVCTRYPSAHNHHHRAITSKIYFFFFSFSCLLFLLHGILFSHFSHIGSGFLSSLNCRCYTLNASERERETFERSLHLHCYGTMLRNYEINWILIYSMFVMKCNISDVIEMYMT